MANGNGEHQLGNRAYHQGVRDGKIETFSKLKAEIIKWQTKWFQSTKDDKVVFLGKSYSIAIAELKTILEVKE